MSTAEVLWIIAGMVAGLVGGAVVLVLRWPRSAAGPPPAADRLVRQKMIVTLKSGAAFEGVLYEADDRTWILRGVVGLGMAERGEHVPVDGELVLFVADIAYAQRP